MASLDEELQQQTEQQPDTSPQESEEEQAEREEIEQEEERQQALQYYNQQQRRRQQLSQAQSPEGTAQTIQKWRKRWKWAVWIFEILAATAPIWGTILLVLFIAGAFIGGCNGSTTFRIASLGSCEPFIIGESVPATYSSGGGGGGADFGGLTDAQARAQLTAAGITVNAPQPQTSLEGILQPTIDEIIALKKGCDASVGSCSVIVTGGTEPGHAGGRCSHASGNKFDVGLNTKLTNYIKTSFAAAGTRSDGAALYTKSGATYALESNHWDVAVGCNSTTE